MARSLNSPKADLRQITVTATLAKGGTGATTRKQAVINLGGIDTAQLGVPGGIVKLDGTGKIPVSQLPPGVAASVTLEGGDVYTNQNAVFVITNYDVKTTYAITVSAGTVSKIGNKITFSAPSTAQIVTMTVNGRAVTFPVLNPVPAKPTILAPAANATALPLAISVVASNYAMTYGPANYKATDWELATDTEFTAVVDSSYSDTFNKTTMLFSGLSISTTYYVRVRYIDKYKGAGPWSDTVSFTTGEKVFPGYEEARLTASDAQNLSYFGAALSCDDAGLRVAVGATEMTVNGISMAGAAYIFVRNVATNTWTQEAKLISPSPAAGDFFGGTLSLDGDGKRLVVNAWNKTVNTQIRVGQVHVYARSDGIWYLEKTIDAPSAHPSSCFGIVVTMSPAGDRLAIFALRETGDAADQGYCYIYARVGSAWSLEKRLIPDGSATGRRGFGHRLVFDESSTHLVLAEPHYCTPTIGYTGMIHVYKRVDNTWVFLASMTNTEPTANEYMGFGLSINRDASIIAAGTHQYSNNKGVVYIFENIDGAGWKQKAKLFSPNIRDFEDFGVRTTLNQEGDTLIVGASAGLITPAQTGLVYAYRRINGTWTYIGFYGGSDTEGGDNYGVLLDASVTGDRVFIAAMVGTSTAGANTGAVYVYR